MTSLIIPTVNTHSKYLIYAVQFVNWSTSLAITSISFSYFLQHSNQEKYKSKLLEQYFGTSQRFSPTQSILLSLGSLLGCLTIAKTVNQTTKFYSRQIIFHPNQKYFNQTKANSLLQQVLQKYPKNKLPPKHIDELLPYHKMKEKQQLVDAIYHSDVTFKTLHFKNINVPIKDLEKVPTGVLKGQKWTSNLKTKDGRYIYLDWDQLEVEQPALWYLFHCCIPWQKTIK